MTRSRRGTVQDLWHRTIRDEHGNTATVSSKRDGVGKRWRARYIDDEGREHTQAFDRKADANSWLEGQTASLVDGTHVSPRNARLTVSQWCVKWLETYSQRESTIREAKTHLRQIEHEFGHMRLAEVRPSNIKAWKKRLKAEDYQPSYVYALYARFNQLMNDAVADGFLGRNPCSKKVAPPMGEAKTYVITTDQVWQLHDAMPDHLKVAVLLGAFCGLRVAEVAGLRVADINFMHGVVSVKQQWDDQPLKSKDSKADIPIPRDLANMLNASVQKYPSEFMVTAGHGTDRCGPWLIQRAVRDVKADIDGLPEKFGFHDLRHHYASLLISSGENVKTVQKRMRHASARTTLDIYSHLWPGADESTRTAVGAAIMQRHTTRKATR